MSGQRAILKAGSGYFETTYYPIGGAFRRAIADVPLTEVTPLDRVVHGCRYTARQGENTIAVSADAIEFVANGDSKQFT